MPIDKSKLQKKLARLEEYINDVRALRKEPDNAYTKTSVIEAAAERRIEKAIQCAIDIASSIVAGESLGLPKQYKDVFIYLGRAGVLPPHLTDRLERMAGFRNNLIHEYETIDPAIVRNAVHSDIDDLVEFAEAIAAKYFA